MADNKEQKLRIKLKRNPSKEQNNNQPQKQKVHIKLKQPASQQNQAETPKKPKLKIRLKNQIEKNVIASQRNGSMKKKTESSLKWYIGMIKKSGQSLANEKGIASTVTTRQKIYIGGMYQYTYDAKWKEVLPYWDAFPLIVVINVYNDGFLGLNLHYLPPIMRARLLDKLMEYSTTIRTGSNGMRTYMRLSYELLKTFTEVPFYKHTIKRYLYSHVKSKIMRIHSDYWEEVAFLPTQQFQKKSHTEVWKDARK